jgi:hypothetical protein
MRNRRWNPALRHTVLGEHGNDAYVAAKSRAKREAQNIELLAAYDLHIERGSNHETSRAAAAVTCHAHGKHNAGRDTLALAHQLDAALEARS